MRVLGIDPSLSGTGLVVLNDDLSVAFASLVNPGARLGPERLHFISKAVEDAAGTYASRELAVDRVYIEGYSYGSPTNREVLGELGGVIRMVLFWANIEYEVIAPTSWRSQLLGKGAIKKDLVGAELMRRYHAELKDVELPSLDVLEAWAIAYAGMQRLRGVYAPPVKRPKKRRVAVAA
jgi:Holliday junction resolvasome RuvABC endonuclease subunit